MTQSWFSVVIPAFRASRFLHETLQSIYSQTLRPAEVIVVDDRSDDDTASVARQFGATVLVQPVNRGPGAARNVGIRHAKTPYVALCDADDLWMPDHLATLHQLVAQFDGVAVAFNRVELFGVLSWQQEQWLAPYHPHNAFLECLLHDVCIPSATAISRARALTLGGFSEDRMVRVEDYEFWTRISRVGTFVCSDRVTVRYRKHAGQMTGSPVPLRRAEYMVRQRILDKLREEGDLALYAAARDVTLRAARERLGEAWDRRSAELMDAALEFAREFIELRGELRNWRLKQRLLPAVRFADWLRTGTRDQGVGRP